MKTATFTELRRRAKAYFDAVERGETVRVLRHGKPIAEIVPASGTRGIPSWKLPAVPLTIKGASLSRAILRDRREARA